MNAHEFDRSSQAFVQKCLAVTRKARKEYARETSNVFANFERVAKSLGLSREKVLLVYLLKHLDGIIAHVDGHTLQRESVEGRIVDAINYLLLLKGMLHEVQSVEVPQGNADSGSVLHVPLETGPSTAEKLARGLLARPHGQGSND